MDVCRLTTDHLGESQRFAERHLVPDHDDIGRVVASDEAGESARSDETIERDCPEFC